MSKNSVPLVSSNPNLLPAMLNGWHGNPAHKISCAGMSSAQISVISPFGSDPKLFL